MTARTEIPCMSDCDIKVNIHAICKHIFAEQELHHRGAATAQIMFDIQEIKRTGGIFGSLYKMATSAEGKENHFMPIGKCPWFLDQKLPHKSNPKNVLCGVGFLIQNQIGLKYSHYAFAFFVVVLSGEVRSPKFLTYINSWDEKGCIQIY